MYNHGGGRTAKELSVFSSINMNNSIVAGGLNVNPGEERIESYNTSISNAGMKMMFRQLRQQAHDDAAKQKKMQHYDSSRAAQRILRDSNDYTTNPLVRAAITTGGTPSALPNAFKTIQVEHRDVLGDKKLAQSSTKGANEYNMTQQRGNSLPKFAMAERMNKLKGGLATASASVTYYNGSQGSFRQKGQSQHAASKLPNVNQMRNLVSERESLQDEGGQNLSQSLFQDAPRKKGGLPIQAFDITQRNIENVRGARVQLATIEMENARKQIDHIHQLLSVDQVTKNEPWRLEKLQSLMDPTLKERFMSSPLHL